MAAKPVKIRGKVTDGVARVKALMTYLLDQLENEKPAIEGAVKTPSPLAG